MINKPAIFLDWDLSLLKRHIHNTCALITQNNPKHTYTDRELYDELTKQGLLETAGDKNSWIKIIETYSAQYHFAIATRSAFPGVINLILKEALGIKTPITIIHGATHSAPNKIWHMKCGLAYFTDSESVKHTGNMISVDDNMGIATANLKGNDLAGSILLDDTHDGFEKIKKLGGQVIRLEAKIEVIKDEFHHVGSSSNASIAEKKLPEKIKAAQNAILVEKNKRKKQEAQEKQVREARENILAGAEKKQSVLQADEEKKEWLCDKLFLIREIIGNKAFLPLAFFAKQIDNDGSTPFKDGIVALTTLLRNLIVNKKYDHSLWGKTTAIVAKNINADKNEAHLVRTIALVLQEAHRKYPEVRDENTARLIEHIENIPGGYRNQAGKLLVDTVPVPVVEEREVQPIPGRSPYRSTN